MIQLAIHEAINGRDLDYAIARATMEEIRRRSLQRQAACR